MVKILGISGSPRSGATEYALKEALKSAEAIDGVETVFWSVKGKKINYCYHCDKCIKDKTLCCIKDDYQEIEELMMEADGFIVASPVYDMSITAQLTAVFNRTRPFYLVHPGMFRNKVGAGITLGGTRHGGQETALQPILHFYMMHEMLVTGGMGGCYNGGKVWTKDEKAEGAANDIVGMKTAKAVGRAVAEAAIVTKEGREKWEKIKETLDIEELEFVEDHEIFNREK